MDTDFYNELIQIANEMGPETSLERLTPAKQKALAQFFKSMTEVAPQPTKSDIGAIAAWAFCVGHEWALRHWGLWLEEKR